MSKRGPRFSEKEKLAILNEGEKNGVKAVRAKYDINDQSYRLWRYKTHGIKPKKQRSRTEKLRIIEQCFQNGINQTCAGYGVDRTNYFRRNGGWCDLSGLQGRPIDSLVLAKAIGDIEPHPQNSVIAHP
jgi:transposase-like protein